MNLAIALPLPAVASYSAEAYAYVESVRTSRTRREWRALADDARRRYDAAIAAYELDSSSFQNMSRAGDEWEAISTLAGASRHLANELTSVPQEIVWGWLGSLAAA